MTVGITFDLHQFGNPEDFLSEIESRLRRQTLITALRASAKVVAKDAKQRVTRAGYPGDKPGKMSLRDSITYVIRDYGQKFFAYVGPRYPQGAHAHLVEFGHDLIGSAVANSAGTSNGQQSQAGEIIGRVKPYPFLRPAFLATREQQVAAFRKALVDAVKAQ